MKADRDKERETYRLSETEGLKELTSLTLT